ncbi:hypothetical protein Angca_008641 [Angiostrongylus cantonensis]|nr:hypothetical protein Angca_008641 [Angiostrongylus cantonensis]
MLQFELKICFDEADGLHFTVNACRACAAFFRRTVALDLRYECRFDGKCHIEKCGPLAQSRAPGREVVWRSGVNKSRRIKTPTLGVAMRNMCRSCRLKKCLEVGMQTSGVQFARDEIGKRNKNPHKNGQTHSTKAKSPKFETTLFSRNGLSQYSSNSRILEMHSLLPSVLNGSTSSAVVILPRMLQGYQHFLTIRRATTALVDKENKAEEFDVLTRNELRSSNFDSSKKVCQLEAHLITDIVNTYFYPFDKLQFTQKAILFKNFFCYLSHTDRAYQSYRLFGQDESNDRLLMPDGGIIKSSELETFYANARGVHSQPTDAAKVFRPSMEFILNVIIPYMRRIQLTEIEYVAILGFLLWNEGMSHDAFTDISRDTIAIIHLTKDSLLDELHEHYQCMGMEGHQITKRIGQLMLLLPHLTRSVVMLRENSELAELFNIFEADICCKSFKAGSYAMEPQP